LSVRVRGVTVRNYRSLRDVTVNLDGLTVLIGPNGPGKTSVLRALELFSGDAPSVTMDDFNDEEQDIQIDLALSCAEGGGALAPYVMGGEVRLRLTYEPSGNPDRPNAKPTQKRHIQTRLNADFDELRKMTRKTDIKPAVASLKEQDVYADLPECESTAKEWMPAFLEYERGFCLARPGHPPVRPGYVTWDTGRVPPERLLDLVYVPAMRDITRDGAGGSGSYLGRLINMAIENSWHEDAEVGNAVQESVMAYGRYFGLLASRVVPQLNYDLNARSRRFAKNTAATIDIGEAPASVPQPSPAITLKEGGHEADIARAGGGLQRVYLMALLGTISEQRRRAPDRAPGSRARLVMIDEPELYQHPQRQRAILRELVRLAESKKLGIQVMCSTHSPYFIELSRIEGLRLRAKDGATSVQSTTRQEIMGPILETYRTDLPRDAALSRWLDMNASRWITEGLFSRLAVLVEGVEDRNVLLAAASVLGAYLDAYEISIVPCHKKSKMPAIAHLFGRFGIPLYMVWDLDYGDRDDREEQEALNRKLFMLADPDNYERNACTDKTKITDRFACFGQDFTSELYGDLDRHESLLKGPRRGKLWPHGRQAGGHSIPKSLLGSKDEVFDLLQDVCDGDPGALRSFKASQIVITLERLGKGRLEREGVPAEGEPGRRGCRQSGGT